MTVIAGQANPLFISAVAHFTSSSRSVSGTGLWRLGIFGSKNDKGTGDRFNYVRQTLKPVDADMPLVNGNDIKFAEAMAEFDIAAIGCNGFNYACMELTKGEEASPDFTQSVLNDDVDNILTLCEMTTCRAGKNKRHSEVFILRKILFVIKFQATVLRFTEYNFYVNIHPSNWNNCF